MQAPPLPAAEASRLQTLAELQLLDTPREAGYDALVRAAALACGAPVSLISLVDDSRQWFKARHGLDALTETPRDVAFCAHAIAGSGIMEVPDAQLDPRFRDNPLVTGGLKIRFYAGMPLALDNGDAVGTLCVIDQRPRQLDAQQREQLRLLGEAAVEMIEQRRRMLMAESRAKQARQQLDEAPIGLFTLDARGRLTEGNRRMQDLWERPALDLMGDLWLESIDLRDRERVRGLWSHSLTKREALTLTFHLRHDAAERRLWVRLSPLSDGRWMGACGLAASGG